MVRTYVCFAWDRPIPDDNSDHDAEAERFSESLKIADLVVSPFEDQQYAWFFTCRTPHLVMNCGLGLVGFPDWILMCDARRGLVDWLLGWTYENEQEQFAKLIESVLRANPAVSNLRRYSKTEWSRPRRRRE